MPRTHARAIVFHDNQLLLMHRINNGKEYYVFPGGGQESNETIPATIMRELQEETSVAVVPEKLLYTLKYDDQDVHYLYLSKYIAGTPHLDPNSEEANKDHAADYYEPLWVNIDQMKNLLLYPLEVRDWLIEDIKNNFENCPRHTFIKLSERRKI